MARLIDRDLAQALQDRILADQKAEKTADMPGDRPDDPRRVEALEAQIAAMEKAVADAEALGERRRQEAESAAKRVEALEARIATLEEALTKTAGEAEQRRRESRLANERANGLVAELVELTGELVEMSRRMSEQTAAMEKMRADFEDSPSLIWPIRNRGGGSP